MILTVLKDGPSYRFSYRGSPVGVVYLGTTGLVEEVSLNTSLPNDRIDRTEAESVMIRLVAMDVARSMSLTYHHEDVEHIPEMREFFYAGQLLDHTAPRFHPDEEVPEYFQSVSPELLTSRIFPVLLIRFGRI